MTDIKKKTMEELEHDYKSFKLIDMYSDYGDITGIQIIRRFISHVNKHFGKMNESIIEFIRLYTDLTEIMDEFTAFFEAWGEMVEANENFILEVRQVLEDWIDDPRLKDLIDERLLQGKLDKDVFNKFKKDFDEMVLNNNKKFSGITDDINKLESLTKGNEYTFKVDNKNNTNIFSVLFKGELGLHFESNMNNVENIDKRIVSNAGYYDVSIGKPDGVVIVDGSVVSEHTKRDGSPYLVWNDIDFDIMSDTSTADDILNSGFKNATQILGRYVHKGVVVRTSSSKEKAQRTVLFKTKNNEVGISVNGGRKNNDVGLTIDEVVDYMCDVYDIEDLFLLDGGGSSQLKVDGVVPYNERNIPAFIFAKLHDETVKSPSTDKNSQIVNTLLKEVLDNVKISHSEIDTYTDFDGTIFLTTVSRYPDRTKFIYIINLISVEDVGADNVVTTMVEQSEHQWRVAAINLQDKERIINKRVIGSLIIISWD